MQSQRLSTFPSQQSAARPEKQAPWKSLQGR